jgi:SAM-dependent methyltransferase
MSDELHPINYQTSWLLQESTGRQHITDVLATIQRDRAVQGQRVVELGSGIGTNLTVFAANNSVLGVEGMPAAVAESNRRGIEAIRGDLEQRIDLPDQSADWVLCIDVLEHLVNPAGCLSNVFRILRAGGHLIINVPNHFDWRGRLRIARGSGIDSQNYFFDSPHWEYPHLRFFSRRSIAELAQLCGFEVVADFGQRFLSFPKEHVWRGLGMRPLMYRAQARWPDMFSSGFFLVCRRL